VRTSDCALPMITQLPSLYTVGHSTHPIETFLALLTARQIALLIDVRSYPSSHRWPQFNLATLERSLEEAGIAYRWFPALGGRRRSKRIDSPHTAWEHSAFRAYADYTETPEFVAGLNDLMNAAHKTRTAVMCSEGVWWRCHRRIVSDCLMINRWECLHIMPDGKLAMHTLPDFARVIKNRIIYDGGQSSLDLNLK
jgi:uncharacterized protein (DUF488 family)